jgi:small subunit ribosomal protein S14
MAKKNIIARELKYKNLISQFIEKRNDILNNKNQNGFNINQNIQKLPKNSCYIKSHNRCIKTGKERGYFRFFKLCRNTIREYAQLGILPGVIKSS